MKGIKQFWIIILGMGLLTGCATYHPNPILPANTAKAFNNRSLDDPGLRAFMETNHVSVPVPDGTWSLKQLTLAAFYYQPSLEEARDQLLASQAAQITAGERPNPAISVTPGYDSQIPGTPSPWIVPVSLDWTIETAGKRGDRMAQARFMAQAARWNLVGTVWQVRTQVRTALLNLYFAQQTESLLRRQEMAESNVVRLLEGQFQAGSVSSYEVTQARIALDNTTLALQAASGQYRQARVELASALGVPLHALAGARFSFRELTEFPKQLTRLSVRQEALVNRADVRSALASYAASQSALKLEVANQYPDLHLGPGYGWNTGSAGDSQWDLGVTLTLPILNQNQGPIAEAEARRKTAAAHFLAVQSQAIGQIDSALIGYQAALEQVATAESLLKNLRQSLNSIRAQAQAGEIAPLALANAQVAFNTGVQSRLNALIQAQQALGQLEDAVQSPLTLSPSALESAERKANAE